VLWIKFTFNRYTFTEHTLWHMHMYFFLWEFIQCALNKYKWGFCMYIIHLNMWRRRRRKRKLNYYILRSQHYCLGRIESIRYVMCKRIHLKYMISLDFLKLFIGELKVNNFLYVKIKEKSTIGLVKRNSADKLCIIIYFIIT